MITLGFDELVEKNQEHLSKLKEKLNIQKLINYDLDQGKLPFVLVTNFSEVTSEEMMEKVEKDGIKGVTILRPYTADDFTETRKVPSGFYLLINIDRGKENINLPPSEAIDLIKKDRRLPLTINDGIAIITHYPEFLMKNNCFSLLASRKENDKRVPAIWINGKKQPNLGWCWNGNPHTWLGSASGEKRI